MVMLRMSYGHSISSVDALLVTATYEATRPVVSAGAGACPVTPWCSGAITAIAMIKKPA